MSQSPDRRELSREDLLGRAEALLARHRPESHGDHEKKQAEEFMLAQPAEFLTDLLELLPDEPENNIAAAFKTGTESNVLRGHIDPNQSPKQKMIQEITRNLFYIIVSAGFRDLESTRRYFLDFKRSHDVEEYKKALLPLIHAINRALAARPGSGSVRGNKSFYDGDIVRNILACLNHPYGNTDSGADINNQCLSYQNTSARSFCQGILGYYQKDPRAETRFISEKDADQKRSTIESRLKNFMERLDRLSAIDQSFDRVTVVLPYEVAKDFYSHKYDIKTILDTIEDQLAYLEKYVPAHQRKMQEDKRVADEEIAREERKMAEALQKSESAVADLCGVVTTLQGSGEGSIEAARIKAEKIKGCLESANKAVPEYFQYVRNVKNGLLTSNKAYLSKVIGILDEVIASINALGKGPTVSSDIEWKNDVNRRDLNVPSDDVKGSRRLLDFQNIEASLERHKGELKTALQEAEQKTVELENSLSGLIVRLEKLRKSIQNIDPSSVKGKILVQLVDDQLRGFEARRSK